MVSSSPAISQSVAIVRLERLDGLNLLNFQTDPDATPSSQNTSLPTPQSDDMHLNTEPGIRANPTHQAPWPQMQSSPILPPPPVIKDYDSFSQGSAEGSFADIPPATCNEFGEPIQPLDISFMQAYNEQAMVNPSAYIEQWRVGVADDDDQDGADMPFMGYFTESEVTGEMQEDAAYQLDYVCLPSSFDADPTAAPTDGSGVEHEQEQREEDPQLLSPLHLSPNKRPRSPSVTSDQRQRRTRPREEHYQHYQGYDYHQQQHQNYTHPTHTPPHSPSPPRPRGRPRHRHQQQQHQYQHQLQHQHQLGASVPGQKVSRSSFDPTPEWNMTPHPLPLPHCTDDFIFNANAFIHNTSNNNSNIPSSNNVLSLTFTASTSDIPHISSTPASASGNGDGTGSYPSPASLSSPSLSKPVHDVHFHVLFQATLDECQDTAAPD
ncbi:hypothetical protein AX16_002521 [Volvariella volvacea WC 439]|nr:hypothetical protein AX16_002521 [Volvariella volvacea WC 439]